MAVKYVRSKTSKGERGRICSSSATERGASVASTVCSSTLIGVVKCRSIAAISDVFERSSSDSAWPTAGGSHTVTCWKGPLSAWRTPEIR